ncbi:hypothetical protein UPTC5117_00259 [Campylobacter lari]|uniref:hypothetical protein n=1 Tax=Campylobacter lari TaxID=201 RepID=UPI00127FC467|nr:hypothetical protein [Campylobacter lari]MBT0741668.1 hypothetical protein [Campylobacter lari]MBT0825498.1 hypothetical protein [Campylobacter lari]MCR6528908.1 hypothetical protein [Campylobacter lari]MCR6536072.1 hypothetical protein [Campylobacter lari]MCR6539672.1 hypothetical protein [Campylobacter lari]
MKKILLFLFFHTFVFANFLPRCDDPKIITLLDQQLKNFYISHYDEMFDIAIKEKLNQSDFETAAIFEKDKIEAFNEIKYFNFGFQNFKFIIDSNILNIKFCSVKASSPFLFSALAIDSNMLEYVKIEGIYSITQLESEIYVAIITGFAIDVFYDFLEDNKKLLKEISMKDFK